MRYLIGRYHEIALKGRNQWRFVAQLKKNLCDTFADFQLGRIRSEGPRLLVELPDDLSDEVAAERAATIFGLQNFSISRAVEPDVELLKQCVIEQARQQNASTFRVRTRREDK